MKTLLIILSFTLSVISIGQSSIFEEKMQAALEEFSNAKQADDFIKVSYKFEQIAAVESTNWLPLYHHAMCYIMASYTENNDASAKKDADLELASQSIEKIKILAPKESEIYALEAYCLTAKMVINPMARAQKYSPLIQATIGKSLAFNPNNPRAKQIKISNDYGTAQFFGSDTENICQSASQLLADWDNYKPSSAIHPTWGKAYLNSIVQSCNASPETEKETVIQSETKTVDSTTLNLTINITDLHSNSGIVLIQLMDENHTVLKSFKGDIKDKACTVVANDLEKGVYAVKYFHDENANMKMDSDKYGRPTEGYGYSNNAKGNMGPPKIKKTLFNLDTDLTISLKTI